MHNTKKFLCSFCFLFCLFLSVQAQRNEDTGIKNVLEAQQLAWNNGNIEEYMQGYWQSDSLMFIGKNGITYGWQPTLNNYKKNYPDTSAMGKLDFEFVEVKRLSAIYYFVTGQWHLTRSIGNVGGYFTLLFRKIKGKWVIVKDHSS